MESDYIEQWCTRELTMSNQVNLYKFYYQLASFATDDEIPTDAP
jgi:hypothetical protein